MYVHVCMWMRQTDEEKTIMEGMGSISSVSDSQNGRRSYMKRWTKKGTRYRKKSRCRIQMREFKIYVQQEREHVKKQSNENARLETR